MNKNRTILMVGIVVAIVAVAAVSFMMLNNNNDDASNDKFKDKYFIYDLEGTDRTDGKAYSGTLKFEVIDIGETQVRMKFDLTLKKDGVDTGVTIPPLWIKYTGNGPGGDPAVPLEKTISTINGSMKVKGAQQPIGADRIMLTIYAGVNDAIPYEVLLNVDNMTSGDINMNVVLKGTLKETNMTP